MEPEISNQEIPNTSQWQNKLEDFKPKLLQG